MGSMVDQRSLNTTLQNISTEVSTDTVQKLTDRHRTRKRHLGTTENSPTRVTLVDLNHLWSTYRPDQREMEGQSSQELQSSLGQSLQCHYSPTETVSRRFSEPLGFVRLVNKILSSIEPPFSELDPQTSGPTPSPDNGSHTNTRSPKERPVEKEKTYLYPRTSRVQRGKRGAEV